ncbi:MAG: 1-acyl-sn-glycerol-3-phosphate acyltransferase [Acidimicrobiales bacterium]|nr:1-acyl-sn-glycerol-3-phosphate acyltransferase [Acidimicrobiales bacterium]
MLGATALGVFSSPVILAGAAVLDLSRGRVRFPSVRVALFLLQYGINDSIEILLAPVLWIRSVLGGGLDRPKSIARYERLQWWSVDVLARRAERLLGLRVDIDPASAAALTPGPVIALSRHVNLVDASLPGLLYQQLGFRARGVIMAELLADPGFDLIYPRTGSVFIPRDNGPEAVALMRAIGDGLDDATAVLLFPEGRLFRPDRLERDRVRLAAADPERAERLRPLRHVLPPRPGGMLALLDTIDADVVVIAHHGLDRYPSFRELARSVPLREPIRVVAWRIPRAEIPIGSAERVAWLDDHWLRVDERIERERASSQVGG